MKSKICFSFFVLLVCQGIFSFSQVQASELTALDFEQIDFLFPIENGEATLALLSVTDTAIPTEEEATIPGENGENGENNGSDGSDDSDTPDDSGSTDPDSDIVCYDKNCTSCTTTNVGSCTKCKTGYEVVSGTCKTPADPNKPVPKKTGKLSSKLRFKGTLDDYKKAGGNNFFQSKTAAALNLDVTQVNVTNVTVGSIIVAFDLYTLSSSTLTVAELKGALDTLGNKKDPSLDFFGQGILDYYGSSVVVTEGGCPAGYYADANSVCQTCQEGCNTCDSEGKCKKTNVGAIVGGVLGGIALILVLVIAYIKRDVLFKGLSSFKSSNRSAAYMKADNQA